MKRFLLFVVLCALMGACNQSALVTGSKNVEITASTEGTLQLEAEDACSYEGTELSTCSGYTGDGYVSVSNTSNANGVEFVVESGSDQTVAVTVRYSNQDGVNRNMRIRRVLPSTSSFLTITMPPTGSCGSWGTAVQNLPLVTGQNFFEIVRFGTVGNRLVDNVTLSDTLSAAACQENTPTPPPGTPTFTWTPTWTNTMTPANTPTPTQTPTVTNTPTITPTPGEETLFLRTMDQQEAFQTQGGFETTAEELNPSAGVVPVLDLGMDGNESEFGFHLGTWYSDPLGETVLPSGNMVLNLFIRRLEATASYLNPYFYVADLDGFGGINQIYCSGQASPVEIPNVLQFQNVSVTTNLGNCPCSEDARLFIEVYAYRNGGGQPSVLAAYNSVLFNSSIKYPVTP